MSSTDLKKEKRLADTWGITFMIIFPLLIILGLLMRLHQGEVIPADPVNFYSSMTLHGLGMAGIIYSLTVSGLWYLNSTRIAKLNIKIGYFCWVAIVIGLGGLAFAALIGKFAAGWYILYPLPFVGANWPRWSTGLATLSLIVLGVAWLIQILHILYALAKEYGGFFNTLGFQYFSKKPLKRELPPVVMITSVALVPALFAFIIGAAMLIMYLLQLFEPALAFDPLMMKNMVMFFGHMLVNVAMYCAVGWVYLLLPEFTKRPLKTDKVLVASWNATLLFITFAYFHHLYMDFAQPKSIQYLGQLISYASAIPATGITMFSVISQFYHSKVKWTIIPLMFLFGMMGWAIGGFAAVVDSTIAVNRVLHNTLWVPAHFHTYMLMGVILFIFGYLFYMFSPKKIGSPERLAKIGFWIFVIGAYGFLLMFYLGGLNSIPRRYLYYKMIPEGNVYSAGILLARIAAGFISMLLIGLIIMYVDLIKKLIRRKKAPFPVSETSLG